MEFKKTDTNELERTLTILIMAVILLIPTFYLLELFGKIPYYRVNSAEIILFLGAMFMCIFIAMYWKLKENRYFTYLDLFALLVIVSLLLSTFFAQNVSLALAGNEFTYEGTIVNITYIIILYACTLIRTSKYRKWIYSSLILFGIIELFVAFMQTVVKSEVFLGGMVLEADETARPFGTLVNQNPFGALMAMFAAAEYGIFFCSGKKGWRIVHGFLAVAFTACLILSGTRGAIVGLALAAFIYSIVVIIRTKKEERNLKKTLIGLGIVIGFVLLAFCCSLLISKSAVISSVSRVETDANTVLSGDKASDIDALGSGRIGIWKGAFRSLFFNHPFLGVGVSNFLLRKYEGYLVAYAYVAHNEYIDILCSQGIVGLVTYLIFEIYIFITALQRLKNDGIVESKELLGLLMAYTAYMIAAFFGWRIVYLTPYFYILTGLMVNRENCKKVSKK